MTILEEIEAMIGAPALQALLEAFGGKRVSIPKKMTENHPIAAVIGIEKAQVLSENFHTQYLEMPIRTAKRARILADLKKGDKPQEIAQRYLVTRQFVMRLNSELAMKTQNNAQGSLF